MHELQEYIFSRSAVSGSLRREAVDLLCGYNNVRRAGNSAAHTAQIEDVRSAVERTTEKRSLLEHVFEFAYGEKF